MRLSGGEAGNGARSEGVGMVVKPRLGWRLPAPLSRSGWDRSSPGLPGGFGGSQLRVAKTPQTNPKLLFGLGAKKNSQMGVCVQARCSQTRQRGRNTLNVGFIKHQEQRSHPRSALGEGVPLALGIAPLEPWGIWVFFRSISRFRCTEVGVACLGLGLVSAVTLCPHCLGCEITAERRDKRCDTGICDQ